jgi:hypothetical protein
VELQTVTDILWQSFANAHAAGVEIEALRSAFDGAVVGGELGTIRPADTKWAYDSWSDEGEWAFTYGIQSIRIRESGRGGLAKGTLSMAHSFYRPEDRIGGSWAGARCSKLYAGVAPTAKPWDVDSLLVDGSGRSEVAQPLSAYRWHRPETPGAWFFCVRLERIDGRDTLVREVLTPLARLLAGAGDDEAFADSRCLLLTDSTFLPV